MTLTDEEEDVMDAEDAHAQILQHLAEYDFWNSLTEQEQEAHIKWALR